MSPDMPLQAESILPLAMSTILANMTSNSSEDVNDGNCLDDNASKYDELHEKKEVDGLEFAAVHVDNNDRHKFPDDLIKGSLEVELARLH